MKSFRRLHQHRLGDETRSPEQHSAGVQETVSTTLREEIQQLRMNHDSKHREIDTEVKAKDPRRSMEQVLELDEANETVRWSSRPCEGRPEGSGRTQEQPASPLGVNSEQEESSGRSVVSASASHEWCEVPVRARAVTMSRRGVRGHRTKRKDETIHTTTWTTHHQTPQRSTTQHSTSWRSATDAPLPREHTGGSRQDTHGTPVLTTVRRPWVAQPHEHAHATQVTDASCEHGWRPNSLVAE